MYDKFEKIRKSRLKIFDIADLSIILGLKAESARVIVARIVKKGILTRLKRDLFILTGETIHDFQIANKLIVPSYISFESALNYWGITTQIPTTITSSAKRSKKILIKEKEFLFSNIPEKIFNVGVVKEQNFFIANREKAILDMIYYASFGKRSLTFDELDLAKIDEKKFKSYLKLYPPLTKKIAKEFMSWI